MKITLYSLVLALFLSSCGGNTNSGSSVEGSLLEQAKMNFMPISTADKPTMDDPRVVLGKKLFFDKRLSVDNSTSCNSCHNMQSFGVDNKALSVGVDGELTKRNSPTILNAHFQFRQFWDGRTKTLKEQVSQPIMAMGEMSMPNEEVLIQKLKSLSEYDPLFASAYPQNQVINKDNMSDALVQFIRSQTFPSRFDQYLNGEIDELNKHELAGLKLFMETGCTDCHQGKLLGGDGFEKFGEYDDYWKHTQSTSIDSGKYLITGLPEDLFVFKVPQLRNIAMTAPYFHDGSVDQLKDAIQVMGKTQLDVELADQEADQIATFLKTLTSNMPKDKALAAGK